jgi:hypothetical protein
MTEAHIKTTAVFMVSVPYFVSHSVTSPLIHTRTLSTMFHPCCHHDDCRLANCVQVSDKHWGYLALVWSIFVLYTVNFRGTQKLVDACYSVLIEPYVNAATGFWKVWGNLITIAPITCYFGYWLLRNSWRSVVDLWKHPLNPWPWHRHQAPADQSPADQTSTNQTLTDQAPAATKPRWQPQPTKPTQWTPPSPPQTSDSEPEESLYSVSESDTGEQEWEVRRIFASRVYRGKLQYQVDWANWKNDDEWYLADGFKNCTALLREFHEESPHQPGPPRRLRIWEQAAKLGFCPPLHRDDNKVALGKTRIPRGYEYNFT